MGSVPFKYSNAQPTNGKKKTCAIQIEFGEVKKRRRNKIRHSWSILPHSSIVCVSLIRARPREKKMAKHKPSKKAPRYFNCLPMSIEFDSSGAIFEI